MGRSAALGARRRKTSEKLAVAALGYAALGWPVCQGASQIRAAAAGRACSCDRVGCPAPGAHPLSPAWQLEASADPAVVAQWWTAAPRSPILLVSGRIFDVLDVPASAGRMALARLGQAGVRPGPVAAGTIPAGIAGAGIAGAGIAGAGAAAAGASDRTLFFVASRTAAAEEDEWWSCHLDCEPETVPAIAGLRWHCRNSYVLAPPPAPGAGAARWLVRPDAAPLPDALRLLEYLADACEEIGR